jgi:DNA polymerase-3 subunit delta'
VTLEKGKKYILIEQIRKLIHELGFKKVAGGYRLSIIYPAEAMTVDAANAFLKSLEEPPPENIFILIVTEPLDLLPTILSRCQKVSFRPIPAEKISEWLVAKRGLEEGKALTLARISEGSLGRALQMSESDFFERRQAAIFELLELPGITSDEAIERAQAFTGKAKKRGAGQEGAGNFGLMDTLVTWKSWYRDLILLGVGGPEELLINHDFSNKLKKFYKNFNIDSLIECFSVLEQAQKDLLKARNIDLLMENSLLTLKKLLAEGSG